MLGGHLVASSATTNSKYGNDTLRGETPPYPSLVGAQEAMTRRELTLATLSGCENPVDLWTKHLAQMEMHECMKKSRLPHSKRTFKIGVDGRKGMRLEPATLRGYGNEKVENID